MTRWRSVKARAVLGALSRLGWEIKRETGSLHKVLSHPGFPDFIFAFHQGEEIGPRMLARTSKHTGLGPEDI